MALLQIKSKCVLKLYFEAIKVLFAFFLGISRMILFVKVSPMIIYLVILDAKV